MSLMDWDANVDPHYRKKYFRPPVETDAPEGAIEKWVVYANPWVGAKELTVLPGQTVTIKDAAAYGCITVQGHGPLARTTAKPPSCCATARCPPTSSSFRKRPPKRAL